MCMILVSMPTEQVPAHKRSHSNSFAEPHGRSVTTKIMRNNEDPESVRVIALVLQRKPDLTVPG